MTGHGSMRPNPRGAEDLLKRMQVTTLYEGRRSVPRVASDLLGPGIASKAVRTMDWNADELAFNGMFYSEPGAQNSPDPARYWIGLVEVTPTGFGAQRVWEYRNPANGPLERIRLFSSGGPTRTYGPWMPMNGLPNQQVFSASGTWFAPNGCTYVQVKVIGGGGGGGGAPATAASQTSAGSGGGGGGYAESTLDVSAVGASQVVTVGAAGTGTTGAGGTGGTSSFGALVVASGGAGGAAHGPSGSFGGSTGGAGGSGSAGQIQAAGAGGSPDSLLGPSGTAGIPGNGGASALGGGGLGVINGLGLAGGGPGGGGGGASDGPSTAARAGGAGAAGLVVVTAFFD